mgnify:CR=1 FL=1
MSGHSTYEPKTGIEKWLDSRLPIIRLGYDSFVDFPTPRNLNYWWTFGGILAVFLMIQIITGIVLAMHYVAHEDMAFQSVARITRDAYLAAGHFEDADHPYMRQIQQVAQRHEDATIWVAERAGRIVGSVTLAVAGEPYADIARADELEFRMLVVDPAVQRSGAGKAMVEAIINHARTLPGVTGAGGLQALIKGGLPVSGERIVIAGSGPLLLASAATAKKNGANVVRIAEQAGRRAVSGFSLGLWRWPNKALQAVTLASGAYRLASHVIEALGSDRLEAVRVQIGSRIEDIACDRLACGFSLVPNTEIGSAFGCEVRNRAIAVDEWQATSLTDHYAAGECTGFGGSELARVEGKIAGLVAVGKQDEARLQWPERQRWQRFADRLNQAFALDPALKTLAKADTLVCRCEDVPYAELANHSSWNSAKLNTRCGMGACQGRICATAAHSLFGWEPPHLRPPFSPARIATLACLDEPAA